ncbi:MAG: hypothetical protein AB7K24_25835 [Gemmataceae bacterium]
MPRVIALAGLLFFFLPSSSAGDSPRWTTFVPIVTDSLKEMVVYLRRWWWGWKKGLQRLETPTGSSVRCV